jgi:hypothetical protein
MEVWEDGNTVTVLLERQTRDPHHRHQLEAEMEMSTLGFTVHPGDTLRIIAAGAHARTRATLIT